MANSRQQAPAADTEMGEKVEQFDAIIIGAGVTGLYQLYRLRELGLSVQVFEDGSGVEVAPGIGTATRAAVSTPRATPMGTRSLKSSCRNGTGKSIFPASRRTSAT